MNVDERCFAATLAHEYGHPSGAHGKWSAWIYRMRRSWAVMAKLFDEDQGLVAKAFILPFRWYWPFFNAYSFVLARQHEYEADKIALEVVGALSVANSLVPCEIAAVYLRDEFWPSVYKNAEKSPTVNRSPYKEMQALLRKIGQHPRAKEWVNVALAQIGNVYDIHPSLRDRLQALDQKPSLPPTLARSAGETLLGPKLEELVGRFDRAWRNHVKGWWKDRHEAAQDARERLARLGSMMQQRTANADEQFEHACLLERFEGWQAAVPAYEAVVERSGRDPRGHFALGRVFVQNQDDRGFTSLKKAAELSADYAIPAARIAIQPLEVQGRFKEANEFRASADRAYEDDREFISVASDFKPGDSYRPHGLGDGELEHVIDAVRRERGVTAAYLARKHVPQFPDRVVIVLGVRLARFANARAVNQSLEGRLDLPYPVLVIELSEHNEVGSARLESMQRVRGSLIL